MARPCVFCAIVAGDASANIVDSWPDTVAFVPLDPVTPGHVLVVPRVHVRDAASDLVVTGTTFNRAAELAGRFDAFNLITSKGSDATQTVLVLPWTDRVKAVAS